MEFYNSNLRIFGVLLIFASVCLDSGRAGALADRDLPILQQGRLRYGDHGQYKCHCFNQSEHCDVITGECSSGCDFEWVGPGCQFRNIAYGRRVRQIVYNPLYYSRSANDNNISTCSYSPVNIPEPPWLTVWIPEYAIVKQLEFLTKKDYLKDFAYFVVKVFNATEESFKNKEPMTSGTVCYENNNFVPLQTRIHVTCDGNPVGNVIQIQLGTSHSQLVICDFRIYEDCQNGFYGHGCENCSENCKNAPFSGKRTCNSLDGGCLHGCKTSWKGYQCDTVLDRTSGEKEPCASHSEITKLKIVLICVGVICMALVVYSVVLTILLKRKTKTKDKAWTRGTSSQRTYAYATVDETHLGDLKTTEETLGATRSKNTGINDESHQYTDLIHGTGDIETAYDAIK